MPRDWQDKLAASGIQYDRLDELIMYYSRIEKNERSRTHEKGSRHVPSLDTGIKGRNKTGPNQGTRNAKTVDPTRPSKNFGAISTKLDCKTPQTATP